MLREVRLKKIWSSRIWACLCGRVVSKVYSPTLILTCLWASGRVLMKALGRHFFVLAENNAIGMAIGLHGIQNNNVLFTLLAIHSSYDIDFCCILGQQTLVEYTQ